MNNETTTQDGATYYWASWRRVMQVAVALGILMLLLFYTDGSLSSSVDYMRAFSASLILMAITAITLGTTFIRIKGNIIYYTSSLFSWSSMDSSDITAITLVPRFFFAKKVTAVQIEKRNPGLFPGMLLSRDAFPDKTIATLVSHLKRLNPSITLDDGIREILRLQGKLEE